MNRLPSTTAARLGWAAFWAALFALLSLLVQARVLAALDEAALRQLAASRPLALTEPINWVFRLGFSQVNAGMAAIWALLLLARWRSPVAALPPLVLFAAIALQAGLRLVVEQPAPPRSFELPRQFAAQPVGYALDKSDAVVRQTFTAVTATPDAPKAERGSFPSGHSCRSLFLALLAAGEIGRLGSRRAWPRPAAWATLLLLSGLIGYSAMFFGYHWPTDVLGGYLLALALLPLARWLGDLHRQRGRRLAIHTAAG